MQLTVPSINACIPNYNYGITYSDDEEETFEDKLRSILAQMEFQHVVRSWDRKGVPFRTHMYVPEIHPVLGTEFHEREDEGHIFKVIACCLYDQVMYI